MNGIWLGLALGLALVFLLGILLHFRVLSPLDRFRGLLDRLDELDAEELKREAERIPGTPGKAARELAAHLAGAEAWTEPGRGGGAEEQYKTHVVDEICQSLLPQSLKERTASLSFALSGGVQGGKRRNCAFYDYFFLDDSALCFMVGEVPGNGIADALFAVVAQTSIRSSLRTGRSLVKTMSEVNAQLYDLGGRKTVRVFVCVLNTVNGRLAFVNAGSAVPLLMRSEESYEWLRTPVYAPVGENESVSYRSELLRLGQGDRLFLYTADLGEMKDRNGDRFGEKEFQAALNRSRTRTRSPEELVSFVQDEAAAFCESGAEVLSSAAVALEYKKGNREYIFTLVRGVPEDAALVTEFLRKTLEEGGVAPKERARQILLADELFALCCRVCREGADVKVECAILPEQRTVHLRMFAPMGGRDPLNLSDDSSGGNAAAYIRGHTKRAAFEAGNQRDMVEIVSELP